MHIYGWKRLFVAIFDGNTNFWSNWDILGLIPRIKQHFMAQKRVYMFVANTYIYFTNTSNKVIFLFEEENFLSKVKEKYESCQTESINYIFWTSRTAQTIRNEVL